MKCTISSRSDLGLESSESDRASSSFRVARLSFALFAFLTSIILGAAATAAPLKVGVMGDSLSAGNGSNWGEYPNWHTQLSLTGDFNIVSNVAVGGATSSGVVYGQQDTIADLVGLGALDYAVLMIGGNDAVEFGPDIALGGSTASFFNTVLGNIQNTLSTVGQAGSANLVVANVPDITVTPSVRIQASLLGITPAQLAYASATIADLNEQIETYALSNGIPVLDLYRLTNEVLDDPPLVIGGQSFSTMFSDGFHPSPIVHSLTASMFIEAINETYDAGIDPISDQQLIGYVTGTTPSGETYFDVSPYVILPGELVPEPSSLSLAALGFFALIAMAIRLHRRSACSP